MKLAPRRLAPRLILLLTLLVAVGYGIAAWSNVRALERQLLNEKALATDQLSRSLTSATWHAMRAGRKDDAYSVMDTMAEHQGVTYIRMFAKEGRVAFSTLQHDADAVAIDALECRICHDHDPPLVGLDIEDRLRVLPDAGDGRRLALLTPIPNEPACSTAACHAHPPELNVLGILDVAVGLEDVDARIAGQQWASTAFTLASILVIGAVIAFFVGRFLGRPIRDLSRDAARLAALDLDHPIVAKTDSELGDLARTFEVLRVQLREAREANARFTADLESQVETRSQELADTQQQLVEADRLASLGRLAASVAHEVNNPISAVHNLAMFLDRIMTGEGVPAERIEAFKRHLGQIASESARAGRIVQDLLSFSRRSRVQWADVDLGDVVRGTMEILEHRVELDRIDLVLELDKDAPAVPGDRSQIEQVIMNLVLNAVEAMKDGGRLIVRTGLETATDMAVLQVEDTGPGMPRAVQRRIFDPFFSTKTGEKGVGLGLAVAYGIVEAHGGRINVHSMEGRGTVFTVRLPLHPAVSVAGSKTEETA